MYWAVVGGTSGQKTDVDDLDYSQYHTWRLYADRLRVSIGTERNRKFVSSKTPQSHCIGRMPILSRTMAGVFLMEISGADKTIKAG